MGRRSSHIDLYPSQQRFIYKSWWVPGDREEEYDYSVSRPDCRVMYRLRAATETGTKSGDAPFEERFYGGLYIVKDGVVLEEAVRFIHKDDKFTSTAEVIARLTAMTEWNELTAQSGWPELWYRIVKIHVGEYEARHGIRKELERLKRGMGTIEKQTSRRLTIVHHEKWGYSEFKPVDESSQEPVATILSEALALSGISLNEAQGAHFRIKRLSGVLGDTKEGDSTPSQTA